MSNNQEKEVFCYTYSAPQQEEINAIRNKYISKEEDKMEQLRRLDKSVNQKGTIVSIILGILGSLILGTGMSLIMSDFGSLFHLYGTDAAVVGGIIGLTGISLMACAYPVYCSLVKKEKKRVAPEILRLTEELLK